MKHNPFKFDFEHFNLRSWSYLRRYFLFAILLLVLSAITVIFAIVPQVFNDIEVKDQLSTEQLNLSGLKNKIGALEESGALATQDNLAHIDMALPSVKPLLQLLSAANTIGQLTQVTVSQVDAAPGTLATAGGELTGTQAKINGLATDDKKSPVAGANTFTLSLNVTGTLDQVSSFIDQMEQTTPLTDITSIDLSRLDNDTTIPYNQAKFLAKLGLTTYYFVQPITTTVSQPLPTLSANDQEFLRVLNGFSYQNVQQQNTIQNGGLTDPFGVNRQGEK